MRRGLALLIVASALGAGPVLAAPRPAGRAVVLPFANLTGEKSFYWIGEAFAMGLSDHLLAAGIDVVSPERRREESQEFGLDPDDPPTLASILLLSALRAQARAGHKQESNN